MCLQYAQQLLTDMEVVLHTNRTLRNLQIFYHGGISPRALSLLARILARNTTLETVAFNVHLSPGCNAALAGGRLLLVCGCGRRWQALVCECVLGCDVAPEGARLCSLVCTCMCSVCIVALEGACLCALVCV